MNPIPRTLTPSRSRLVTRPGRDTLLAAFFVAMAFSISASQLLLALLGVLAIPWHPAVQRQGLRDGLTRLADRVWATVTPFRRCPLTAPFLALVGLTLLSAAGSGDAGWSLWIARDALRIATFYVVLGLTRDSDHAFRLWQGFLAALTVMAIYGLIQASACGTRVAGLPESWVSAVCIHPSRIRGPFSIYMTFGGVLMLGALVFVAALARLPWSRIWWMVPGLTLTLAALAFTQARNAWLGFLVGALSIVAPRRAGRVAVLLLGVAVLVAVVAPSTVRQRVRSVADLHDETLRDRLAMWRSGLAMIRDHPVLGVGPGQVRAWYPHYRRPEAVRPSTGHLHNSAIQIAAERGLPALGVWLWLWIAFARAARRTLARLGLGRPRERALVWASLGGVVGFLVAGLFEHTFGKGQIVMLVYALMTLPFVVERELTPAAPESAAARPHDPVSPMI